MNLRVALRFQVTFELILNLLLFLVEATLNRPNFVISILRIKTFFSYKTNGIEIIFMLSISLV